MPALLVKFLYNSESFLSKLVRSNLSLVSSKTSILSSLP